MLAPSCPFIRISPVLQTLQLSCALIPLIFSIASKILAVGLALKKPALYNSIGTVLFSLDIFFKVPDTTTSLRDSSLLNIISVSIKSSFLNVTFKTFGLKPTKETMYLFSPFLAWILNLPELSEIIAFFRLELKIVAPIIKLLF